MSIELLKSLSSASYIISVILLLVSVAIFFVFDIIRAFGVVSGSTEKKAIEDIRHRNEINENNLYKSKNFESSKVKTTDEVCKNDLDKKKNSFIKVFSKNSNNNDLTADLPSMYKNSEDTEAPDDSHYQPVINTKAEETTVLSNVHQSNETTVLINTFELNTINNFRVDVEIEFVESSEIIE